MFSEAIWIAAVALEAFLLIRSFFQPLIKHYPYFYSYFGFVLAQDVVRMFVYVRHPGIYPHVYWSTQLLGLFFGCGVLWEIYRGSLSPFPGARRFARNVLAILVAILLLKAILSHGLWTSNQAILTALDTERDLRLMQAVLLTALLSVFAFYTLSLGRNLRSLVLGYGIFLATSVVNLAIRGQLGERFQPTWQFLQPSLYIFVLCVWSVGMWRYSPVDLPRNTLQIQEDYERLTRSTRSRLRELRTRVNKGIRA